MKTDIIRYYLLPNSIAMKLQLKKLHKYIQYVLIFWPVTCLYFWLQSFNTVEFSNNTL